MSYLLTYCSTTHDDYHRCLHQDSQESVLAFVKQTCRPRMFFISHRNNARPHTAKTTLEDLTAKKIKVLPHPPCSPDLAPCGYLFFSKIEGTVEKPDVFHKYGHLLSLQPDMRLHSGYQIR